MACRAFLDTVRVMLSEMQIEGVIMAEEFAQVSPEHHQALLAELEQEQALTGKKDQHWLYQP